MILTSVKNYNDMGTHIDLVKSSINIDMVRHHATTRAAPRRRHIHTPEITPLHHQRSTEILYLWCLSFFTLSGV